MACRLGASETRRYALGMRVLIIDDDPISAAFLVEWLTRRGCAVASAASLSELNELLSDHPDWLILDRHLPDGDGLNWLHHAHHQLSAQTLLLSGDDLGDRLPAGVQSLRKPVDPTQLWACMSGTALAELDDEVALRALNGRSEVIDTIRAMFRLELLNAEWRCELSDPARAALHLPAVHRLSGAAAMTGALKLAAVARSIETQLRRGEAPGKPLTQALETAITQILPRLPGHSG